jgi:RNA polymerase sigma-70 factor (ECF subfamily)
MAAGSVPLSDRPLSDRPVSDRPVSDRHWTDWLDRHGAALLLFARQWVPCSADAEDVVQDAFVRFWRSHQDVADPSGYLFACVKHCAWDRQRQTKRQLRREEAAARPEGESLFSGRPEQDERAGAIDSALQNLPEVQREVLVLKIWAGLTYAQIADALQISANTAASRYRYALARLREELVEETIL